MSVEIQRRPTSDPDARAALDRLFFIMERLDIMAHNPAPDGMVKVTAIMWRDRISPDIRTVRAALEPSEHPRRPANE